MVSYCELVIKDHGIQSCIDCRLNKSKSTDDELEIEDFAWDDVKEVFHYPCPCGDRFEINRSQLAKGEDVATCPSCSLLVRVIYDMMDYEESSDDSGEETDQDASAISIL